jgi:type IV secretory pathway VirB2 component (pilin)
VAALAFIQVVLAVVVLGYEIIAGRLAWPPVLFLIAALIILVLEWRRRLVPAR